MTATTTTPQTLTTTSADGTTIAYERTGSGPAVVLVDGAMCTRDFGPMRPVGRSALGRLHGLRLRPPRPWGERRYSSVRRAAGDRGPRGGHRRHGWPVPRLRIVLRRGVGPRGRDGGRTDSQARPLGAALRRHREGRRRARPRGELHRTGRGGQAGRRRHLLPDQDGRSASVRRADHEAQPEGLAEDAGRRTHHPLRRPHHGRLRRTRRAPGLDQPADPGRTRRSREAEHARRGRSPSRTPSRTPSSASCRARCTTWRPRRSARCCGSGSSAAEQP